MFNSLFQHVIPRSLLSQLQSVVLMTQSSFDSTSGERGSLFSFQDEKFKHFSCVAFTYIAAFLKQEKDQFKLPSASLKFSELKFLKSQVLLSKSQKFALPCGISNTEGWVVIIGLNLLHTAANTKYVLKKCKPQIRIF